MYNSMIMPIANKKENGMGLKPKRLPIAVKGRIRTIRTTNIVAIIKCFPAILLNNDLGF